MQHAYEGSTPSTGLRVRLLPSSLCFIFCFYFWQSGILFLLPPPFSHKPLGARMCNIRTHPTRYLRSQYLGASLPRSLYKTGLMPKTCVMLPHEPFIHHYMHRYDLSFGQAGLPGSCAYPFPIVRLGGKGSTSAIVTAGSAGCVPRTG